MFTPITAFYASLLAIFFFYLTVLVILQRRSRKISLGHNGDKDFNQLIRAHANFAEYTPLILVLMLLAELNHVGSIWLHVAGVSLLFGRVIHAIGLRRHKGVSWQRIVGMVLTFTAMLETAILNLLTVV